MESKSKIAKFETNIVFLDYSVTLDSLLVICQGEAPKIIQMRTASEIKNLNVFQEGAYYGAWNQDGSRVLVIGTDNVLTVLDSENLDNVIYSKKLTDSELDFDENRIIATFGETEETTVFLPGSQKLSYWKESNGTEYQLEMEAQEGQSIGSVLSLSKKIVLVGYSPSNQVKILELSDNGLEAQTLETLKSENPIYSSELSSKGITSDKKYFTDYEGNGYKVDISKFMKLKKNKVASKKASIVKRRPIIMEEEEEEEVIVKKPLVMKRSVQKQTKIIESFDTKASVSKSSAKKSESHVVVENITTQEETMVKEIVNDDDIEQAMKEFEFELEEDDKKDISNKESVKKELSVEEEIEDEIEETATPEEEVNIDATDALLQHRQEEQEQDENKPNEEEKTVDELKSIKKERIRSKKARNMPMIVDDDEEDLKMLEAIRNPTVPVEKNSTSKNGIVEDDIVMSRGLRAPAVNISSKLNKMVNVLPQGALSTLMAKNSLEGKAVFLAWNMIGKVIYRHTEEDTSVLDIIYNIDGLPKKLLENDEEYTMADIDYRGVLLANTGIVHQEDEYDDEELEDSLKQAKIQFIGHRAEQEWKLSLPVGENIREIAMGSNFAAAATSRSFVRLYSPEGNEFFVLGCKDSVIGLAAFETHLAILKHSGIPLQNEQTLSLQIMDVSTLNLVLETQVIISAHSVVEWFGYSTEGIIHVKDSFNVVWRLVNKGIWTPVHDTRNRFWMTGATSSDIYGVKLAYDEYFPEPYNCPESRRIPMKMAFNSSRKGYSELSMDLIQREGNQNIAQVWGHMNNCYVSGDPKDHQRSMMPSNKELSEMKLKRDRNIINQVRIAVQEEREDEAIWLAMKCESYQTMELCVKLVTSMGKAYMASKIKLLYNKLGAANFLGKRSSPINDRVFQDTTAMRMPVYLPSVRKICLMEQKPKGRRLQKEIVKSSQYQSMQSNNTSFHSLKNQINDRSNDQQEKSSEKQDSFIEPENIDTNSSRKRSEMSSAVSVRNLNLIKRERANRKRSKGLMNFWLDCSLLQERELSRIN